MLNGTFSDYDLSYQTTGFKGLPIKRDTVKVKEEQKIRKTRGENFTDNQMAAIHTLQKKWSLETDRNRDHCRKKAVIQERCLLLGNGCKMSNSIWQEAVSELQAFFSMPVDESRRNGWKSCSYETCLSLWANRGKPSV